MSKPYKNLPPPNFWRKLGLQAAVVALVLTLVCFGIYKAYGSWRKSGLLKDARAHFAKGDYPSALLSAKWVIEADPLHQEANLLAADIADRAGQPDAVAWRRRVVQLNPGAAEPALAWARTAVKFGQFEAAQAALDAVPEAARAKANYQQLAGGVAAGSGRPQDAGKFYAEAFRLDPANEMHVYNHANWMLQTEKDADRRKVAEAMLEKLTNSATVGTHAHRGLLNAAAERRLWARALAHSLALTQQPGASPADWALHLQALAALKDPRLTADLARAQAAANQPLLVVVILHWMETHGRAEEAISWAASLKPELTGDANVAVTLAECLDSAKKWEGLKAHTATGNWKDKEYLRLAYSSRAYRELGDLGNANTRWTAAALAVRNPESASQLVLRLGQWGWKAEASELLWKMADNSSSTWALGALNRLYQSELNTGGLLRVATALVKADPTNDAARNNVASLSLLLNKDVPQSTALAAELYAKHPKRVVIAATHAFALLKADRAAEALKVMEAFKPEELRIPGIAATYGLLLRTAGRKEAAEYLAIADKAPLLPEERALVKQSLSALSAQP